AGPRQAQNEINTDSAVSKKLLEFKATNRVKYGNLLTLPVGGGLLYVEPLYVSQATTTSSFPLLRSVIVAFGDKVAIGDTLQSALGQVFGGQSGITDGSDSGSSGSGSGSGSVPKGSASAALAQAISDAQAAMADGREALKDGDFAAYGKA